MSSSPQQPRLYRDLARLWPLLSPAEDYVEEATTLRKLVAERGPPAGATGGMQRLLELGAGGGHVLVHLENQFECTATDLSESMLEQCAQLIPNVRRVAADMRTVRLNEQFDVVLLLDAVDYMKSEDDVLAALTTAKTHLAPGGLLLLAPTYTRESFEDGEVADDGTTTEEEDITYFSYVHDPDPKDSEYEMILLYLLRNHATRKVEVIEDRHQCGLFGEAQWLSFLERSDLPAEVIEDDKAWTLFAGVRR